jgi:hypothetical protein
MIACEDSNGIPCLAWRVLHKCLVPLLHSPETILCEAVANSELVLFRFQAMRLASAVSGSAAAKAGGAAMVTGPTHERGLEVRLHF